MSEYKVGDQIYLRDRRMGRAMKIKLKVVGVLPQDYYACMIETGLNKGNIKIYKYWDLISVDFDE